MLCELITQLKKLQKSAPESIDNTNSLDAFETYLHVENEVERDLRTLLQNANTKQDSYLSVDIDEEAIARIYKQIKQLEQTEIGLKVQLESNRKNRTSLHSEAIRANTAYHRYVESVLKGLELSDDSGRIITYAQKATAFLRACLKSFDKNGGVEDNREKTSGSWGKWINIQVISAGKNIS